MRATWAIAIMVAACSGEDVDSLTLDGPDQVTVKALGDVEAPRAVLEDGEVPEGLVWESTKPAVAVVDGSRVTAVAPGEALIQGRWRNQTVVWQLVVDPVVVVRFVKPPLSLAVGERRTFEVEVTMGGNRVDSGSLAWTAKPATVVNVDEATGEVVAIAPGTGWVMVRRGAAEAMVEVLVTE